MDAGDEEVLIRGLKAAGSIALVLASGVCLLVALAVSRPPAPPVATAAPSTPTATVVAGPSASAPPPAPSAEPSAEVQSRDPSDAESCNIEDRGAGPYHERDPGVAGARLFLPEPLPASYDLVLHFHGGEPARRLLAPEALGIVLATVDAGVGSQKYAAAFGPKTLDELLASIDAIAAPAKRRSLTVSSWSAGFGAVRELLNRSPAAARAFVLLDSVHTAYGDAGTLDEAGLVPFFGLAERAAKSEQLMVLTHSAITPPGYASTSEVAAAIIAKLGGRRRYAGLEPHAGTLLKTRFDRGDLHVRGYTGSDKPAHCAQLRLLPEILAHDVLPFVAR